MRPTPHPPRQQNRQTQRQARTQSLSRCNDEQKPQCDDHPMRGLTQRGATILEQEGHIMISASERPHVAVAGELAAQVNARAPFVTAHLNPRRLSTLKESKVEFLTSQLTSSSTMMISDQAAMAMQGKQALEAARSARTPAEGNGGSPNHSRLLRIQNAVQHDTDGRFLNDMETSTSAFVCLPPTGSDKRIAYSRRLGGAAQVRRGTRVSSRPDICQ
jgi:hypothetical protein